MATRTSSQSGNWSSTSTWGGAAVPVNGDAVIISTGHDVVFDVDQSGVANGLLSLQIDGILRFKVDSITALKMNGKITGAGSLYVGNSEEDPIQRPPSGTESRCQLIFNSTATINVPTIRMYGWYPSREYTQLDADAELNATEIVLKEDLGLQQGDKVIISSGTEYGDMVETNKGIYVVQSYDSGTKTVTLTSGLQTLRLKDDYVAWVSRPIKISRTSGTTTLCNTTTFIDNGIIIGVYSPIAIYVNSTNYSRLSKNWICRHSTAFNRYLFSAGRDITITDCISISYYISGYTSGNSIMERCMTFASGLYVGRGLNTKIKDSIAVNSYFMGMGGIFLNCKYRGSYLQDVTSKTVFKDCIIDTNEIGDSVSYPFPQPGVFKIINSVFKDNNKGYFLACSPDLYNCLFEGVKEYIPPTEEFVRDNLAYIQSFNHNQIEGNYKAWCKGGIIETVDNKLKFICESEDYPVFKDYPILAPANRTIKRLIALSKSTPEIVTKLQFIDPTNDPLIDSSATPLAESSEIVNNQIGVAYKSDTPKQIILRIFCQNSTGNVIIDTTRIDQSLAKRIS